MDGALDATLNPLCAWVNGGTLVESCHTPQRGTSCLVKGDDKRAYHGHFDNRHGEQAVFVCVCHLGNIAMRVGRRLRFDAKT